MHTINHNLPVAEQDLPADRTWVLAHRVAENWGDCNATNPGGQYWNVVQFRRGLTDLERSNCPDEERRRTTRGEDKHANNREPYNWPEFGPGCWFGQEVDCWVELPLNPVLDPNNPTGFGLDREEE